MKWVGFVMVAAVLTSFTNNKETVNVDGVWMGYYRSEFSKEKLIVKFNESAHTEFYTGGVDDKSKTTGSYKIFGDSVTIAYISPDGIEMTLKGHFNRKQNFVDGVWVINNKTGGSFYLEKQDIVEYFARP